MTDPIESGCKRGSLEVNLYMNHVSQEMIRTERSQILHAAQEDIRALAAVVEAMLKAEQICVIGSEEKIEERKRDVSGSERRCFRKHRIRRT